MPTFAIMEVRDGIWTYRPRGTYSLVEAVDLVSAAVAYCRDQGANRLLVDVTGLDGVSIPTLIDRFLMAEDFAQNSKDMVFVAMVAPAHYIHPHKFGVNVAEHFGLICDVYTSEKPARKWLLESEADAPPNAE